MPEPPVPPPGRAPAPDDLELVACTAADLDEVLDLVAAYHRFEAIEMAAGERRHTLARLIGDPDLGSIWLIRRGRRTLGYVAVCLGYSIEFGGRDAFLDELYLVDGERGRGVGRWAIDRVSELLAGQDVRAVHLEVAKDNAPALRLYGRAGFALRSAFHLMSRRL